MYVSNLVAYLSRYDSTDTRSVNSISVPPLPDAHFESELGNQHDRIRSDPSGHGGCGPQGESHISSSEHEAFEALSLAPPVEAERNPEEPENRKQDPADVWIKYGFVLVH